MKRSEFFERFKALLVEAGVSPYDAEIDAGVEASHYASSGRLTWDSEGPEVLWEVPNTPGGWHAFQILSDGSVRSRGPYDAGKWRKHPEPLHPISAELVRRLLEERKQQEALDEHNDKMETQLSMDDPGYARRSAEIAQESARLFGSALGLDDSPDYDKLLAVWRLWGPDGELRRLLRSHDRPGHGWYSQLRSELLALPDEVKP